MLLFQCFILAPFIDHISQPDDIVRSHNSWISNGPSCPWGAGAFAFGVQRYHVGHCITLGLAVRPALLLSALEEGNKSEESLEDNRQLVLFSDIQGGLESRFIKIYIPKGRPTGVAKTLGLWFHARISSSDGFPFSLGCKNLLCWFFFFPKSKDGLLYLMNTYSLKVLGSLKMFLFYLFYSNGEGASLKA